LHYSAEVEKYLLLKKKLQTNEFVIHNVWNIKVCMVEANSVKELSITVPCDL